MTTTRGPVGTSPHRVGGRSRVTGLQKYVADIHFGDELHVKLVTLDSARARIVSIDTTKAAQVPGVLLVLTEKDLPQPVPRFGPQFQDRPVLAVGETKYHGEPVAAVAAETKDAAEEAASLVWVEYEPLPGVYTIADALDADAPIVQDSSTRPGDPFADTNVCSEHHFGWGDVDKVEAEADHVIERTYSFPMVTHFAIEPHGFMAAPDGEDGVVVWSTIQHPFLLQKILAKILDLPLAKVRIIAPDPGGGFGGKQNPKFEPLVALMAIRTGRPVRLILSLEETFQAVRRAAAEVRVRMGFELDGTMVFTDVEAQFLIGAYVDIADRVVGKSSYLAAGPYRVPAVRVVGRGILSHTTPSTAFRGFGVPQLTWARESTLDEAALQLGIDPLEVRMRNLPAYQEEFIPGDTPADGDWAEAVRTGAELIGWDTPLLSGHGRGLAISIKSGPTTGLSYSTVRLLADGSVIIFCGTSDMGQGARTIFAQIAAHELGVELERVSVVMGDTAIVPYDQQTSASRSSVLMGTAVLRACRDVQQQVREMASKAHQIEVEEIVVDAGVVQFPDRETTIVEVAKAGMGRLGGELIGNGEMRKEPEPDHPLGGSAVFFEFNYTAIEVEVDEETGEIVIVRHVTVGDVGRSLNPNQVRGQDEGAAIMGLGHTLMEQIILDDSGRIRNLGALDYRIPTSQDLPVELTGVSVENADGPGPYGAKGLSEGSLLCTAPAVGAAVRDATGLVIRDLPLTPQRVWEAMRERQ
ncbi:MAG: xanthine dehydrogenase family protein molybdopterin-binding subunit [Acidimicrobiales bacterium]|nr:xanthine dehydrogenase [Dehalococcoidales bacterium]MDP6077605.1 xanthine dehydrogenase family protein molybdopterin-binding subunit [Acidimicrobiales bacterium]MDP7219714.1 xanthine dehydrogenase family protein molybdopterin-binding subunit [Arenicellales bacterium]